MTFAMKDADKLWTHINGMLKDRLSCSCNGPMDSSEFLRKYNIGKCAKVLRDIKTFCLRMTADDSQNPAGTTPRRRC